MRVLKEKPPIPARLDGIAGGSGQEQNTHKNHTISPACRQALSPRQKRCLQILLGYPDGILSSELREKIKTNNIAQYFRSLRLKELIISCDLELCLIDGEQCQVGRYRLHSGSRGHAIELLEVRP